MLSKEEVKENRIAFWGTLDTLMDKIRNPHESKVQWLNYNTGVKHLYFRMEADEEGARLCIDLQFPDKDIREIYYAQFTELKDQLEKRIDDLEWIAAWDHWNGKQISRIMVKQEGTDLHNKSDWDSMHEFLKLNLIQLDEFWCEFGAVFQNLK